MCICFLVIKWEERQPSVSSGLKRSGKQNLQPQCYPGNAAVVYSMAMLQWLGSRESPKFPSLEGAGQRMLFQAHLSLPPPPPLKISFIISATHWHLWSKTVSLREKRRKKEKQKGKIGYSDYLSVCKPAQDYSHKFLGSGGTKCYGAYLSCPELLSLNRNKNLFLSSFLRKDNTWG